MTRRAPMSPPPTMQERADAAIAARAYNQRAVELFGQFVRLSLLDRVKFGEGWKPSGKARVG
ncbi:hypothetical protein R1A27_04880 [Methylobacterium sp. NMS12]|uniref:hypothetical protein n=1 Tax=Methylobacterium sp. NMS12 TaxID=3079766 RepID=UPI003F8802F8